MLKSLFSIVLISLSLLACTWVPGTVAPAWGIPLTPQSVAVLPGLQGVFAGDMPEHLGVQDGLLSPCPDSPNCVVSQGVDLDHRIAPLTYQNDRATARAALLKVLSVVPGTQVVEQSEEYIRTESTSKLMGFVDDTEFYFPADASVIEVRSAARIGASDLGVNRRRLEQIRLALADLGV
jgi:uncharacterized protein (DUF1499 family)